MIAFQFFFFELSHRQRIWVCGIAVPIGLMYYIHATIMFWNEELTMTILSRRIAISELLLTSILTLDFFCVKMFITALYNPDGLVLLSHNMKISKEPNE